MDPAEYPFENGAAGSPFGDSRSLGSHARRLRRDATVLATEVSDTTADVERCLAARMKAQPYATLGVALGAGYILGGGLRSRLTLVLLSAATRLATVLAMREIGDRMTAVDSSTFPHKKA